MKLISYKQYLEMSESDPDVVLVDTRMPAFARAGRLENSIVLTVQDVVREADFGAHLAPKPEDAARIFENAGIDSSHPVVLAGDYTDPAMARIAWTLEYAGHPDVYCISESIALLRKNGVLTTSTVREKNPAKFEATPDVSLLIGPDEIKSSDSLYVIDARSMPEYAAGHLPGSVLIPHTSGLGEAGTHFADKKTLEATFEGVPKDRDLVCYCMHGTRASSLFYQLRMAGFERVRLYDGSFVQWRGLGLSLE